MAVISHRGQEVFNVAIMGFRNSVSYVQRQIDNIMRDYKDFCRIYVDGMIVASTSLEEHEAHLRKIFARLKEFSICINPKKTFLGFQVFSI